MPSPSEPDGWDATHVLQLVNPVTNGWSCPTVTKKNSRCANVVSRERCINVTLMINSISLEDARVIARDHKRELTNLAEMMLCPLHSSGADSKEKVQGVVMQWKNYINTSMRRQAQPPSRHTNTKPPTFNCQPTDGPRARQFDRIPEAKATVPRGKSRIPKPAPDITPQGISPSYGTTINRDTVKEVMKALKDLTSKNTKLRNQNKELRDKNAQLAEERDIAAREAKQARIQLEITERSQAILDKQVDEQFQEINTLRDREAAQVKKISSLKDTLQKTTSAYHRLKQIQTAASVVPKGKV